MSLKPGDRVSAIKGKKTFEGFRGDWSGTVIRDCSAPSDAGRIVHYVGRGFIAQKFFVIERDDGIGNDGWYIYEDDVEIVNPRTAFDDLRDKWTRSSHGTVQEG